MPKPIALIAEDDLITRMDAVDVFDDAGFDVLEASSADEALAILEARSDVLLLLTDVEMPGEIDGLELANTVHEKWPSIDIVVCSGRFKPSDGDLPKPVLFLGKPVDRVSLVEKARERSG